MKRLLPYLAGFSRPVLIAGAIYRHEDMAFQSAGDATAEGRGPVFIREELIEVDVADGNAVSAVFTHADVRALPILDLLTALHGRVGRVGHDTIAGVGLSGPYHSTPTVRAGS
jgi:hypothetical protein